MAIDGKADFFVIPQGTYLDLAGLTLAEVIAGDFERLAGFCRAHPTAAPNVRPNWHVEQNVSPDRRPSFGTEQYRINDDGTLGERVANWDSSD